MATPVPDGLRALLFDMDGVLTDTARVHTQAWRQVFEEAGQTFSDDDYRTYVDGKPRLDGVRSFLRDGRGLDVGEDRVREIGDRKNVLVLELIRGQGVDVYDGSRRFVEAARERGIGTAVVSSSANAREALRSAGMDGLFDAWVEGVRIDEEGLAGKPAPDTFLLAARDLGVGPSEAAVFEDAIAGVEAGRAGDFAWVVGVDRTGHPDALREHGADVVVTDLDELELA